MDMFNSKQKKFNKHEYIQHLKEVNNSLSEENIILKEKMKIIEDKMKMFEEKKLNFDNQKKITDNFRTKTDFVVKFFKFVKNNISLSHSIKIFGSFVRNMFEKIYLNIDDKTGYGDCRGNDVDMVIFDNIYEYTDYKIYFDIFIDKLRKIMMINNISSDKILIGEYYLTNIKANSDDPKHISYVLKFINKNDNTELIIDMNAYLIKNGDISQYNHPLYNIDFDVNAIYLCENGFKIDGITTEFDMFDTLNNIMNKTAVSGIPFSDYCRDAEEGLRIKKVDALKKVNHFILKRIKIMDKGYKLKGVYGLPDFRIEKTEPCEITMFSPPYPVIKLKCNHEMSLMSFAGILFKRVSEYSEKISCPMCRETLLPKILMCTPEKISEPQIPTYPFEEEIKIDKPVSLTGLSKENYDFIIELLTHTHTSAQQIPIGIPFPSMAPTDALETNEALIEDDQYHMGHLPPTT